MDPPALRFMVGLIDYSCKKNNCSCFVIHIEKKVADGMNDGIYGSTHEHVNLKGLAER